MEMSGQLHSPAALPPGTHGIGCWVDPRGGLQDMEKLNNSCPYQDSNSDPSIVQLVASHYTDCATAALTFKMDIWHVFVGGCG
jgi:hypothetical protein